jgi:hypothetical protein
MRTASAVSHAVSTLSGAQHDSAQRTSAATKRSISRQDAEAAKQVDSDLGVLGALARKFGLKARRISAFI